MDDGRVGDRLYQMAAKGDIDSLLLCDYYTEFIDNLQKNHRYTERDFTNLTDRPEREFLRFTNKRRLKPEYVLLINCCL